MRITPRPTPAADSTNTQQASHNTGPRVHYTSTLTDQPLGNTLPPQQIPTRPPVCLPEARPGINAERCSNPSTRLGLCLQKCSSAAVQCGVGGPCVVVVHFLGTGGSAAVGVQAPPPPPHYPTPPSPPSRSEWALSVGVNTTRKSPAEHSTKMEYGVEPLMADIKSERSAGSWLQYTLQFWSTPSTQMDLDPYVLWQNQNYLLYTL